MDEEEEEVSSQSLVKFDSFVLNIIVAGWMEF